MAVVINGDTGISPVTASGTSASVDGMTVGRGGGEVSTNTVVGYQAGQSNTTGYSVTSVGYQALYTNTAAHNTALGYQALFANAGGSNNTAVGDSAGVAVTSGIRNTVLGSFALQTETTGNYNTAVGFNALNTQNGANNNVAIGYQAGYSNTTSTDNTYMGNKAGYSTSSGSGSNTFIGQQAGYSHTTGQNNQFFGGGSGYYISTGSKNTILGAYTGNQGGLDIRTLSNRIVLSDGDGNPRLYYDNNGAIQSTSAVGNGTLYPAVFCRAWARFVGSTATIYGSANISSVTRNSTGNYTCYFTTAMPDSNYAAVATADIAGWNTGATQVGGQGTANFSCNSRNLSMTQTDAEISVAVFR